MQKLLLKYRKYIFTLFSLLISLILLAFWKSEQESQEVPHNFGIGESVLSSAANIGKAAELTSLEATAALQAQAALGNIGTELSFIEVDIKGAVNAAALYRIRADANLNDLIKLAGGLSEDAAKEYINLAQILEPNCLYRIPSHSEIQQLLDSESDYKLPPGLLKVLTPDFVAQLNLFNVKEKIVTPTAMSESVKQLPAAEDNRTAATIANNLLNINSCSLDELLTVPQIGATLAKRIISYREEHGRFQNFAELTNVKGIKAARLAKLRAYLYCD